MLARTPNVDWKAHVEIDRQRTPPNPFPKDKLLELFVRIRRACRYRCAYSMLHTAYRSVDMIFVYAARGTMAPRFWAHKQPHKTPHNTTNTSFDIQSGQTPSLFRCRCTNIKYAARNKRAETGEGEVFLAGHAQWSPMCSDSFRFHYQWRCDCDCYAYNMVQHGTTWYMHMYTCTIQVK